MPSGEDQLIARYFKPLATAPGAFSLTDDAAVFSPPPDCLLNRGAFSAAASSSISFGGSAAQASSRCTGRRRDRLYMASPSRWLGLYSAAKKFLMTSQPDGASGSAAAPAPVGFPGCPLADGPGAGSYRLTLLATLRTSAPSA